MANMRTATDKIEFVIEGMDCGDCARTIEKAVAAIPGIKEASVSFGAGRLAVKTDQHDLQAAIERKVSEAGYRATPANKRTQIEQVPFWKRERRVLTRS